MYFWILFFIATFIILIRNRRKRDVIAFFHPYCNAGGGGERVLWCAIRAMQQKWPHLQYYVYSGDYDATKEQILLKAKQRFGITVDPRNVHFVFLRLRPLVEAYLYPRFTLLLQTLGGLFLGLEALLKLNPSIFIDTMGYGLTLPLFRWIAGSRVSAYVHYPTISCDMIDLVSRRERTYNNADFIAQNNLLSHAKLAYYRMFAFFYGLAGRAAEVVMVNGSWTGGHIKRIWECDVKVVFPPCDVSSFLNLEQISEDKFAHDRVLRIISIGQIRPEKNHQLQLEVLRSLKEKLQERRDHDEITVELTIAGGCRNAEDQARVQKLKSLVKAWDLTENVKWKLNVAYEELLDALSESMISIHTMWNEHFGIAVVEGMAAGNILLAHDSGGPELDILRPADLKQEQPLGFLASTKDENGTQIWNVYLESAHQGATNDTRSLQFATLDYVQLILHIVDMSRAEREQIRGAARSSVNRFSESEFERKWMHAVEPLIS